MALEQERFILDMLAAWGDGRDGSRPDIERIMATFADDAITAPALRTFLAPPGWRGHIER